MSLSHAAQGAQDISRAGRIVVARARSATVAEHKLHVITCSLPSAIHLLKSMGKVEHLLAENLYLSLLGTRAS